MAPSGLTADQREYRNVAPSGLTANQRDYRNAAPSGLTANQRDYRNAAPSGLLAGQRKYRNVAVRSWEDEPNVLECNGPGELGSEGKIQLEPAQDQVLTQDMFATFSQCQYLYLGDPYLRIADIAGAAFSSMPELQELAIENNDLRPPPGVHSHVLTQSQ